VTPAALTTLLASIASRIDDHFKTEDEDDIGEGLADP